MQRNKILYSTISFILGVVFIFSAFSKLYPVTTFITSIYDRFGMVYKWSELLGKSIIGLEIALGLLLILNVYGKWRWVLKVSIAVLIAFTGFIISIWLYEGNDADCGCFGEIVKLNPFWSIIKNIVMLGLLFLLLIKYKPKLSTRSTYFSWIITTLCIIYPFVFYPSELGIAKVYQSIPQNVDYTKGKHLVAFMSLTCSHCKNAATQFEQYKRENNQLPIVFFFSENPNKEEFLKSFLAETGVKNTPIYFINPEDFREFAGKGVPSIYLINNDIIVDKIDYFPGYSRSQFEAWLKH